MTYLPGSGTINDRFCYGDGSDGAVTYNGGGTTTLSDDVHATTLTVTNNTNLQVNGFRIFAQTSVTVDSGSSIHSNGSDASGWFRGAGAISSGPLISATNGGNGFNSAPPVNGGSRDPSLGGSGGDGGNGYGSGTNNGASGGTATAPVVAQGSVRAGLQALNSWMISRGTVEALRPGCGGGGGNANGDEPSGALGGGGGGGGGYLIIAAKTLTNNGTISANGGNGGNASNGGGGGGGGGGVVVTIAETRSGSAPTASAGSGGSGAGGGDNGDAGSAGTVIQI